MLTSTQCIQEFIQALQEEIDALKKGKGGSIVKVFNGRLLRESSGYFIYLFHLENFLAAIDDTPAEIEIDGKKSQCSVMAVHGLDVQIALERDYGQNIAEARLQTNLWFLLESLRKKFEEMKSNPGDRLGLSEKLFNGISNIIVQQAAPVFAPSTTPPNESQDRAIGESFSRSLAVIWGPPGTGKTNAIAKAVEAHLGAGRRVLLVSHANMAVDEALEQVAEQLAAGPFYQEGKLVRLGICHKPTLQERYPLVILENISTMQGETLTREKGDLLSERERVDRFLESCKLLFSLQFAEESLTKEADVYERSSSDTLKRLAAAKAEITVLEADQLKNRENLAILQQMGTLKRWVLGLSPQRIQKEIDRLKVVIEARKRALTELAQRSGEVQDQARRKRDELNKAMAALSGHVAELGITREQLATEKQAKASRRDSINSRIPEIDKALDELQKRILSEVSLVATTLTKTYTAKQFPDQPFDVIIIDESSMAPLPHVFWAASKATTYATIVGDFKQLPPICISDGAMAKKWLGRSIFDVLKITTVAEAAADVRVSLLDTQYRMAPRIAEIPNRLFYDSKLKHHHSTQDHVLQEPFGDRNNLVFIDTSSLNPWCSRLSTGGRFNIYSALVATTLAQKLSEHLNGDSVGIVTPYRAQSKLISKIAQDRGIIDDNSLRVNTVHSFQGGEEQVIILDCVEGPGAPRWSMLDDQRPNSDARLLLNVALTRARCKVFLIAHKDYLFSSLNREAVLLRIINYFCEDGCAISSEVIVDNYPAADFDRWADAALGPEYRYDPDDSSLHTEKTFWPAFLSDLRTVQSRLMIMSPFISLNRAGKLLEFFRALCSRNVNLRIYTKPPSEQGGSLAEHAEQVIQQLQSIGATVIQRKGMHQKIALIDDRIAWEGSLNILSHNDTQEQMRRIEGVNAVKEIAWNMELDKNDGVGNMTDKFCPQCQAGGIISNMVVRQGKYGTFWGCTRYPACKHTEHISKRAR
jgi:KaiC/GvpD/RAD55 family RecA-like ATPase